MKKGKYYKNIYHGIIVKCLKSSTQKKAHALIVSGIEFGIKPIDQVVCIENYEPYSPSFIELIYFKYGEIKIKFPAIPTISEKKITFFSLLVIAIQLLVIIFKMK
jgi:hypothetical protein